MLISVGMGEGQATQAIGGPDLLASQGRLFKGLAGFGAQFLEDKGRRAETGEGRLQQIQPDKGSKPEPVDGMYLGQCQGDQDEGPSHGKNQSINTHN